MKRLWIIAGGCLGVAIMMSLRGLAADGYCRAAIAAAAFSWAALATVLVTRKAR